MTLYTALTEFSYALNGWGASVPLKIFSWIFCCPSIKKWKLGLMRNSMGKHVCLSSKTKDESSISGSHMVEGESHFTDCLFTSTHMLKLMCTLIICTYPYTHTPAIHKIYFVNCQSNIFCHFLSIRVKSKTCINWLLLFTFSNALKFFFVKEKSSDVYFLSL